MSCVVVDLLLFSCGEFAFSWSLRVSPAAVAFFIAIFAADSMISFLRSLRRAFTVLLLRIDYFFAQKY